MDEVGLDCGIYLLTHLVEDAGSLVLHKSADQLRFLALSSCPLALWVYFLNSKHSAEQV